MDPLGDEVTHHSEKKAAGENVDLGVGADEVAVGVGDGSGNRLPKTQVGEGRV